MTTFDVGKNLTNLPQECEAGLPESRPAPVPGWKMRTPKKKKREIFDEKSYASEFDSTKAFIKTYSSLSSLSCCAGPSRRCLVTRRSFEEEETTLSQRTQNVDSAATVASLRVPSNPHETGSFGLFLTPETMFNFLDESKDVHGPSETILRILKSVQSEFPCPTRPVVSVEGSPSPEETKTDGEEKKGGKKLLPGFIFRKCRSGNSLTMMSFDPREKEKKMVADRGRPKSRSQIMFGVSRRKHLAGRGERVAGWSGGFGQVKSI
ncbi:hypothetical protein RUM44_008546 [Polyplax serrata]|uniref:Uncharacterized protein n=1 Tax=Polyplax serrata TaxID=468196 RepID=A0ABR1B8K3_POLSC